MIDLSAFVLVKYLHLISIFSMIACLTTQLVLLKTTMSRNEIRRLAKIDGLYGLAAIMTVAAGLTLWFGVGKGSEFYNHSTMHIKLMLVTLVGLISVTPTIYFLRNRKGEPNDLITLPPHIKKLVIIQLIILGLIPPLATMVAYGVRL